MHPTALHFGTAFLFIPFTLLIVHLYCRLHTADRKENGTYCRIRFSPAIENKTYRCTIDCGF